MLQYLPVEIAGTTGDLDCFAFGAFPFGVFRFAADDNIPLFVLQ
jgi:hypothetical protein